MKTSELHGSSKPFRSLLLRRSSLGLLGLLLLIGGGLIGGGMLVWRTFAPASDPTPAEMAQGFPPTPVQTVSLKRGEGIQRIQLLGQVEANKSAKVRRSPL